MNIKESLLRILSLDKKPIVDIAEKKIQDALTH